VNVHGGLDGARHNLLKQASRLLFICILGDGMVMSLLLCSVMLHHAHLHIEVLGRRQEVWLPAVARPRTTLIS